MTVGICGYEDMLTWAILLTGGSSGSLLFFHQAPQFEKESGAEGEEEIGDSQEPLRIIL